MQNQAQRASRRLAILLATAGLLGASAAIAQPPPPAAAAAPRERFPTVINHDAVYKQAMADREALLKGMSPVTDATLTNPPAGDWLMWRRSYSSLGFSALTQINKANVRQLTPAWSWTLATSSNEITPLVHDGVLFVFSANRVQALDGASGDMLWEYVRGPTPGFNPANAVMRGIAISGDRLFIPTADRHMVALETRTGKVLWDKEIVPALAIGVRLGGAPMIIHDKVIEGVSSCNSLKGGCYIVALDTKTGDEVWRFNSIARPGQPGGDSWNGAPVDQRFGGAVWTTGSYDPDLNLLYYGIGQTYDTATLLQPRARKGESEDALFTNATVALDPDTGKLVWHYQHFNRDVWDFDWVFERTLIDLPVGGVTRKVSVTAGKIAIIDVIDRETGQYLSSKDLGLQTLVTAIDPKTGRKTVAANLTPEANKPKTICPHAGGARSWPATSYNPKTKILYMPLVESCMDFTWVPQSPEDTLTGGSDIRFLLKARPDSDGNFGRLDAINLETGKTVWSQRRRAPSSASTLATAGGLVFDGGRDRMFRASDDLTGKVLWQTRLNAAPSSTPITYSVKGVQYVAVVAGGGGAHDITWGGLTPELSTPAGGTTLAVFRLPPQPKGK